MFANKNIKINTNDKDIDSALTRSVAEILPSKEELKNRLKEGKQMHIYIGADATGPDLHIGHATNFLFIERMRKLGHKVTILFGDFTAQIGDPTDKSATRTTLTKEEVQKNCKTWKEQVAKIIKIKDKKNPANIKNNSKWLSSLKMDKIIQLASFFTIQHMIERDMFDKRIKSGKPVYLHEFLYPLIQGYDSVCLDVDAEVGGTDQTFNMLAGRTLQKKIKNKEKFIITTKLLEHPKTGKKLMSKSEGDYIALNDDPDNMFGKSMALPDEVMTQVYEDCTNSTQDEVDEFKKEINQDKNPRDTKLKLASKIVATYYGEKKAKEAYDNFIKTFSKKEIPENIDEVFGTTGEEVAEILVRKEVVASKSDFRRLVDGGGITDLETKEKISAYNIILEKNLTLKIGKHRFIKIIQNQLNQ